jgi:murein L,D-transpeptidase YcbB/YkuD
MHHLLLLLLLAAQQPALPPAPAPAPVVPVAPVAPPSGAPRAVFTLVEASNMLELRWPNFIDYKQHLRNFYEPLAWAPQWTRDRRLTPQARAIIALFEAADAKGVHATDYDGGRWAARVRALEQSPDEAALARFDVAFSATLMRYISDLHIGRINPHNVRFELDIESKKYYLPTFLTNLATSPNPAATLAPIEPPYDDYRRLQNALAVYRRLAAEDAKEPPLPEVKGLAPGQTYAALPQLVRMLRRVGDLPANAAIDPKRNVYDGAIVAAVKRFQSRHGIEGNGTIGPRTFDELNTPLAQRVRQLEWALERWRWAPMEFDTPPIIVNIPEFTLRGWDANGHTTIAMPVVVGTAYTHQTPVFESDMKYLVFRPYWNVPTSIQMHELVPKIAKNSAYLTNGGYEIVDGDRPIPMARVDTATLARLRSGALGIRQKPGPSNALGLVKFLFPNANNVYLHSTPSQALFSKTRRDFSHGCIRVEDPAGLAAWVLRDQAQWTREKIVAAMNGTEPTTVVLAKPIPVLIIYTTAVVTDDGAVHFYDDIYNHDTTLENALAAGYPYPG